MADIARTQPADSAQGSCGSDHLRRQRSGDSISGDRAASAARRCAECPGGLIDDAGFGASSAFGGPCHTPNAEKLAAQGLRFNRFHTTALCSPSRQSLLTGRNHHSVGMGGITEIATRLRGTTPSAPTTQRPSPRPFG